LLTYLKVPELIETTHYDQLLLVWKQSLKRNKHKPLIYKQTVH